MKIRKISSRPQLLDINLPGWRNHIASGILALKIVMDALGARTPDINALIKLGIGNKAYEPGHGWQHPKLAKIATLHGLAAEAYNWARQKNDTAFERLRNATIQGPSLVSISRNFDPENGEHMIVVRRISKKWVFYHETTARKRKRIPRKISHKIFLGGWKKSGIIIKR